MQRLYGIIKRLWYALAVIIAVGFAIAGVGSAYRNPTFALEMFAAAFIYIPVSTVGLHWLIRWIWFGHSDFPFKR